MCNKKAKLHVSEISEEQCDAIDENTSENTTRQHVDIEIEDKIENEVKLEDF